MKKKIDCILLVDDDVNCNFFHQRLISKMMIAEKVVTAENGRIALDFLRASGTAENPTPSVIFLDINMPVMNGWDFLEEYKKFDDSLKAKIVVIMLTTSLNPDDRDKAMSFGLINGFQNKYLNNESLKEALIKYFPESF